MKQLSAAHGIYIYAFTQQYSNSTKFVWIHSDLIYEKDRYQVFTQPTITQMLLSKPSAFHELCDALKQVHDQHRYGDMQQQDICHRHLQANRNMRQCPTDFRPWEHLIYNFIRNSSLKPFHVMAK